MVEDYKRLVMDRISDTETFVKAVFSGRQHGQRVPYRKVTVRPVRIRDQRHVQFSYLDEKQDITKNYAGDEVLEKLRALLALPFNNIHVQTTREDVQIRITKKGKVFVHRKPSSASHKKPDLAHDRKKALLLPVDKPDPFLQEIGIMTKHGRVRANMQSKFRQINEFLKLVVETGDLEALGRSAINIVDCGCGSAHLTLAVHYYLNQMMGYTANLVGIDLNEELIARRSQQCKTLGWDQLAFQAVRIIDYAPNRLPDIVLALHACDTATDEALAQGIRWDSQMIFSAPCCHRHLHRQLEQQSPPAPFDPLMRHNVFKERFGDLLTDALRVLILQIMGYRADVVEFVSTEHTGKNLMIRAVKAGPPGVDTRAIQEYLALKTAWHVTPYLEELLGEAMIQFLG